MTNTIDAMRKKRTTQLNHLKGNSAHHSSRFNEYTLFAYLSEVYLSILHYPEFAARTEFINTICDRNVWTINNKQWPFLTLWLIVFSLSLPHSWPLLSCFCSFCQTSIIGSGKSHLHSLGVLICDLCSSHRSINMWIFKAYLHKSVYNLDFVPIFRTLPKIESEWKCKKKSSKGNKCQRTKFPSFLFWSNNLWRTVCFGMRD